MSEQNVTSHRVRWLACNIKTLISRSVIGMFNVVPHMGLMQLPATGAPPNGP